MKRATRISVICILLSVLFLALISCSGTQVAEEYNISYDETEDAYFMGGYPLKIVVSMNQESNRTYLGYLENTLGSEMALKRVHDVEAKMDCKIDVSCEDAFDYGAAKMNTMLMAAQYYTDIYMAMEVSVAEFARAGLLTGMKDYIDLTDTGKWGNIDLNMSMFWQDDQYGVVPASWPEIVYMAVAYPFVVNENIIAKNSLVDPREHVEDNTWNYSTFEDYIIACTQTDGERTVYGFASHTPYIAQDLARSNGGKQLDYTKGRLPFNETGFYTPESRLALEELTRLLYGDLSYCNYPTDDRFVARDAFVENQAAIVCTNTYLLLGTENAIVYTCDNFGVIPCPKGPNAEKQLYPASYAYQSGIICVPINAKDQDATMAIMNQIYEPLEGFETRDKCIDSLARSVFFDRRDAETIYLMSDHCEYEFFREGARAILEYVAGYSVKAMTVTEALETYENSMEKIYTKYVDPTYDGIVAVWGDFSNQ